MASPYSPSTCAILSEFRLCGYIDPVSDAGTAVAVTDTLDAFIADLLPTDATPGAAEAGTAAGVRAALAERPPLAALVEQGLRALDRAAAHQDGQPFAALPPAQRHALLTLLARGIPPPGWTAADPAPEAFWATLRSLAVGLFY